GIQPWLSVAQPSPSHKPGSHSCPAPERYRQESDREEQPRNLGSEVCASSDQVVGVMPIGGPIDATGFSADRQTLDVTIRENGKKSSTQNSYLFAARLFPFDPGRQQSTAREN